MDYIIRDIDNDVWHLCRRRALDERTTMKDVLRQFLAHYSDPSPRRTRDLLTEITRAHAADSEVTK